MLFRSTHNELESPELTHFLSHQEMKQLTDLSLSSIRNKASRGKLITAKDGFTYRYDKNPQVLKWLRLPS